MQKYDVVIIGSGLGGLLCGYMLSKEGYKVCVLEKNKQIGGCLQTFSRDGSVFDTGVHYVGGYDKGQNLWQYFKYFDLVDHVKAVRMDETGFDRVAFLNDDKEYSIAMGYECFADTLLKSFPNEKDALNKYCNKIKGVCDNFPLYNLEIPQKNMFEVEYFSNNACEYINSLTANSKLRGVLAGQNPLYAGVANKTPLYVHALIVNSFLQSAWRFEDGSSQIADCLVKSIKGFGGEVTSEAGVSSIIVNGEKVKSVLLHNSACIEADYFISDISPKATMAMLKGDNIRTAYKERINGLENTTSAFILYASLKKDRIKYMNYNYFCYYDENVWDCMTYTDDNWPKSCFLFTPATSNSKEYAESAIALSYMNYNDVKKWGNTSLGKRGPEYNDFKKKKAEQMIRFIERKWPKFKDCIKSYYTSSPLTFRDYTGTEDGSLYGVLKSSIDPIKTIILPKTKIANLYLTGQNIVLHGVLGVTISSVLACSELLGLENIMNKIKKA